MAPTIGEGHGDGPADTDGMGDSVALWLCEGEAVVEAFPDCVGVDGFVEGVLGFRNSVSGLGDRLGDTDGTRVSVPT